MPHETDSNATNGQRSHAAPSGDSPTRTKTPLAIIGYACRLPGGVVDAASYWQLLTEGIDAVSEVPSDRWNVKAFSGRAGLQGKSASRWGGFLDQIDQFEPECFGISPREARYIDPQQRLLLETTYDALEQAGIPYESLAGSRTGVFVGVSTGDYGQIQRNPTTQRGLSPFTAQGCSMSIAANRISYCLDLRGPSFIVDTACSSSLVALDRAAKSLADGESELAIVGGVNIIINPETFISFSQASMLSPDGRCKAFDASANGFVRAEGGGAFVLKRLDDAVRDGDHVYGVIIGSGTNQDGRTGGISMPNPEAQEDLLRDVYTDFGVDPSKIKYVEAHGTGTAVGDPSETQALGRVFGPGRTDDLIIGSCKTNLGHLEAASGVASMCKALLMLEHRKIPASLHFRNPNPHIPFDEHRLRVVTGLEPWPEQSADGEPADEPMIIGVNSFGFGGASAHVILAEYEPEPASVAPGASSSNGHNGVVAPPSDQPLVLSARSDKALRNLAENWITFLKKSGTSASLADVAFTAANRRSHFEHRLSMLAATKQEACEQLTAFLADESRSALHTGEARSAATQVGFVFCGQGPQAFQMGSELLKSEPVFRRVMEKIDGLLQPVVGWSLIEELSRDEDSSNIQKTLYAQPSLFAIHVALARLWESWGVVPSSVVGHSVGEIAAAHIAGILSLEDATKIIGHRGESLQQHAKPGSMIAVAMTQDDAKTILQDFAPAVCLAAVNSPQMMTLAGDSDAVDRLGGQLTQKKIWWKPLRVKHAFHSHLVDDARSMFMENIGEIVTHNPTCTMISTVTAEPVNADDLKADYWWDNIRQPVRFADAIQYLRKQSIDVFLELGPHPVLSGSIKQSRQADESAATVFASLERGEPNRRTMLAAVGGLFTQGVAMNWRKFWDESARMVDLPRHGWNRTTCWHESPDCRQHRLQPNYHPLLGNQTSGADHIWHSALDMQDKTWIADHRAGDRIIFPAAGLVELLIAAASRVLESGTVAIDDIGIQRGLFLRPDAVPTTQVTGEAAGGHLTIASRTNESEDVWTKHAIATFRELPTSIRPARLDIDAWKSAAMPASVTEFYDTFTAMGLNYGPAFTGVRELYRQENAALGRVSLPEDMAEEVGDYLAHPALLDACFQVLLEATPNENRLTDRMFLPERIDRVYFRQSPGANAWSEVRLRHTSSMRAVGDLRIFTADGEPAIEVFGLECRALILSTEKRDVNSFMFRTMWQQAPLPDTATVAVPLPTDRPLREQVDAADRTAVTTWHYELPEISENLQKQDRVATAYLMNGLRRMGFELVAGEVVNLAQLINDGLVIERHRPLFTACCERLVNEGRADKNEESVWTLTSGIEEHAKLDVATEWREALAKFPDIYPHLRLLELCGQDLEKVFSGELDALELLFNDEANDLLEQVYRDQAWTRYANTFIQKLCEGVAATTSADRPIRILEIGAGTGGTTAYTLPALPDHRAEYWFTDLSPFFLSKAEDKFRQHEFVRYALFDVEKDPVAQGLPLRAFDVIIAADVLHATGNLMASLRNCSELLVDGGMLVLRELTSTRPSFDLLFGLTDGWWNWKTKGDASRSNSALLMPDEWNELLVDAGFDQPTPSLTSRLSDDCAATIVARQPQRKDSAPVEIAVPAGELSEQNWMIFADEAGEGERLAQRLRTVGKRAVVVRAGEGFRAAGANNGDPVDAFTIAPDSFDDMTRVVRESGLFNQVGNDTTSVVHLWSTDITAAGNDVQSTQELIEHETRSCHSVMHLVQALTTDDIQPPERLILVTRGARDIDSDVSEAGALQGNLVGFARVVATEYRQLAVRLVDLDANATEIDVALWAELNGHDPQTEVAWRGPHRLVPRLEPMPAFTRLPASSGDSKSDKAAYAVVEGMDSGATTEARLEAARAVLFNPTHENMVPFELNIGRPGDLSSLSICEIERTPPGPDEVQIDVHFVALNFRDILKALGQFPAEDPAQLPAGDECAGIVSAVGSGVSDIAVGDRVLACAVGCFRSVLTVEQERVMKIPANLSLAAAVTMPVAYITVLYALQTVGRLKADESLLVHSAAGGVGSAAMHVARMKNARIFATAGTEPKRALIDKYDVQRVMNSRDLEFFDHVMDATDGDGVDMVLNSLAGKAMTRSLACVGNRGRFLELGKRDFYENTSVGLYPFRHNVSYHAIDLSQLMAESPREANGLLRDVFEGPNSLPPLPLRILPAAQIQNGFRQMGQGTHIGKLVVDMTQTWGMVLRTPGDAKIRGDATYLLTGAFGGIGLETARWLADRGAKHLVMLSRSGPKTDHAREALDKMRSLGVEVRVAKCDINDPETLAKLLAEVRDEMPPIVGVFHLAMVLDDVVIGKLDRERFLGVTRPKAHGAWHLHRLTRDCPLEMFVLFSSVSSVVGNFGQANYAAANAALESLAAHRRSQGLPATAINWGVLGEVGYVAEREDLSESLGKLGFTEMTVEDIRATMDASLDEGSVAAELPATVAVRVDWPKLGQRFRNAVLTPGIISRLVASDEAEEETTGGVRELLDEAEPAERRGLMLNFTRARVARVLGMSPQKTETERPLSEMGLDSLMAVELASIVETDLGVSVPVSALSREVTITKLSDTLLTAMFGADTSGSAGPGAAMPATDTRPAATVPASLSPAGCLVPLRDGDESPPVFLFHPAGGELRIYESLISKLAGDFPIYGVQGSDEPVHDLTELGARYADAITASAPTGPIRVFGFSFGGLVAAHTAQSLKQRGRTIDFVGVIELNPGRLDDKAGREERLARFICETYELVRAEMDFFKPIDPETLAKEAAEVARDFKPDAILDWLVNSGHMAPNAPLGLVRDYFGRLGTDLMLMVNDTSGISPFKIPVHVWSASEGMGDGLDFWQQWSTHECVHQEIGGKHFTVMFAPHVTDLAEQLSAALTVEASTKR
jgi:acyl transferase domain-containing protein/NADPH:quinone reductase-like Zn-dependent oxidoreductase/thioesterase domain-containing protein/SAM-dependent methyltransferase/acyl carrier protein